MLDPKLLRNNIAFVTQELLRRGLALDFLQLNYPDDSTYGKAVASAYNNWIKKRSIKFPKIMLESHHSYFSRLTGGTWHEVRRYIKKNT